MTFVCAYTLSESNRKADGEKVEFKIRNIQLQAAREEIRCCEELNRIYGLTLTEQDITELVELRQQALHRTGRVEFGGGILPKLIRAFCSSPYVDSYHYAQILGDLQDAFYYFKNESEDLFSDDELIEFMAMVFNGRAEGSVELLNTMSLEQLCRWARNGFTDYCHDEEAF